MASHKVRFSLLTLLALMGVVAIALASYRLGYQAADRQVGSVDLLEAKVLSLAELAQVAEDREIFYQGSSNQFHYIRFEDRGYFRLRGTEVTIPEYGFEGDGSAALGGIWKILTIENGRLKASDRPSGGFN